MVRQGAWNSVLLILPAIAPKRSRGVDNRVYIRRTITMVPNVSAAVAPCIIATVFRKQNVIKKGPENRHPVSKTFFTCRQILFFSNAN